MRGLILPPLATPDPVTTHRPGEFMGSGHSNAGTDDEYLCAEQCHRHCGGSPGIAVGKSLQFTEESRCGWVGHAKAPLGQRGYEATTANEFGVAAWKLQTCKLPTRTHNTTQSTNCLSRQTSHAVRQTSCVRTQPGEGCACTSITWQSYRH